MVVSLRIENVSRPINELQKDILKTFKQLDKTYSFSYTLAEREINKNIDQLKKKHVDSLIYSKKNDINDNTISIVINDFITFHLVKLRLLV